MVQATKELVKVAEAELGERMSVTFYSNGTASLGYSDECPRCGAQSSDGEAFDPAEAWHLLQAVRRFLRTDAYRQAQEAIRRAIEGP
ncbi:MAG: hypothetical protein NZ695_01910 [Dehalococcoidia bacterium]|nr:hypothetical protein [Dehalococcoidia bacterium]